jgi:hypothetical protein
MTVATFGVRFAAGVIATLFAIVGWEIYDFFR